MKPFEWNQKKNTSLKIERNVSFEDVVLAFQEGKVLDDFHHPNQARYPGQRIMVIDIRNYAHFVPYIEDEEKVFLKTIIPSRKANKKYLAERRNEK